MTASDAGAFDDNNIHGENKYDADKPFSDTDKGVTISGVWPRGVRADETGSALLYDAAEIKADTVRLGKDETKEPAGDDLTWGDPRVLLGRCDFTNVKEIDATHLKFTNPEGVLVGSIVSLLTGATNLETNLPVEYAEGSEAHTQDITDYTVSNGTKLDATLTGTVATAAGVVNYHAESIELTKVDLAGWDVKTASAVPTGWTGTGVDVQTDGFVPTTDLAGTTRTILTASEAGTFNDKNISGENKYNKDNPDKTFANTDKGVTISGFWLRGVRADETGSALVYDASEIEANTVRLGKDESAKLVGDDLTWGDPRVLVDKYDFTNVTKIDAKNLTFTNPEVIPVGSATPLLLGATNLEADLPVEYAKGTTHTQGITGYAVSNGATLDATLTGTVSTAANTVNYNAESVELAHVDLAKWDGKNVSAVPKGWTAQTGGVIVDGEFKAAVELAGSTWLILTADPGVFENAKIDENIAYGSKPFNSPGTDEGNKGVSVSGTWSHGVQVNQGGSALLYNSGTLEADTIALGTMTWGDPRVMLGKCDFTNVNDNAINTKNLTFTNPEAIPVGSVSPLLTNATNLKADLSVVGSAHTQGIAGYAVSNGAKLDATLTGTVSTAADTVNYTADSIRLTDVDLAGWDGKTASEVPKGWTGTKTPVKTDGFTVTDSLMAGVSLPILNATAGVFDDSAIGGENKFRTVTGDSTKNNVTLTGSVDRGVKAGPEGASLLYVAGKYDISGITVGPDVVFTEGDVLRAASGNPCDYTKVSTVDVSTFSLANPTEVAGGRSMTLLAANTTLKEIAVQTKEQAYSMVPVSGVSLTGKLTGDVFARGGFVSYRAAENRAESLNFGSVEWKDTGALMNRPEAIVFDGASVDTSTINFTGITSMDKRKTMTLVANFDGTPGSIKGDTYHIGTAVSGKGKASIAGNDLIFTAETAGASDAAHALLMGLGAGMQALEVGNSFIGEAAEELSLSSNVGADGVSTFAKMGGGSIRQETGSHIDVRTWNAILALGTKNEKETGTTNWGAFFEYGTGNYTTHDGADRGDGSTTYTGGGLLAKWRAKSGFYVEGSARAGNLRGDSRNVLRDGARVPYTCDIDSPYMGAHIGIGRTLEMKDGNLLDVYGKYLYNRRESFSFDAGGHYDIDDLTSQILRVGARYIMKRESWNFYGGLAYEHELDGKATGKANGLDIRGVDMSGGSLRIELGAAMQPDKNSPWSLDFNVTGYAGKKRGVMGGISVGFAF